MKRFYLFFLLLLSFAVLLFSSCEEECRHQSMTESKIDATCTQNGETVYTCVDCEYSYKANIIEPKGHVFEKTVVNSTCTTDGYTEYRCACGYAYISDYISATGHEYVDTIVSPNCLTAGHTTHKCKNCEYSYISNQTDPVSHKYVESVVPPTGIYNFLV